MYEEGEIQVAKCKKCGESFPVFIFVADTDMVTTGCVSLTGKGNKIVLTMQTASESGQETEVRVGLGYKMVQVRYLDEGPSAKGMSFQEFRKVYKPPTPIYSCISCGSDSEVIKTETKSQFLTYGNIEVVNGS